MPASRMMPDEYVGDAVARLSGIRWSWSIADIDQLIAQLRWSLERPAAHGVAYLRTTYATNYGMAMVMYRQDRADSIVLPLTERLEHRFPDRIDAFAAVVAAATQVAGPPPDRRPGRRPRVWWSAANGLLGVGDNGSFIDLELRSARFEAELAVGRERTRKEREFKALNPDWDQDDNDILSSLPPF
jgi:Family of unknown function (DUF6301)